MHASTLNLRRLLGHAVLGLMLLFAQQFAMRHWLSHAIEATHIAAKASPSEVHCAVCDGLAAFGGVLPTYSAKRAEFPELVEVLRAANPASQHAPDVLAGYRSRAPPPLV